MSQGYTHGLPIDTDGSLSNNSDQLVPSQAAIVKYVAAIGGGSGGASIATRVPMSPGSPQTISSGLGSPTDVTGATTSFTPTATGNHLIIMSFDVGATAVGLAEQFVGIVAVNGVAQPAGGNDVHAVFFSPTLNERACVCNTVVVPLTKGVTYTIKLQGYVNAVSPTNTFVVFPTHTGFSIVGAVGAGGGGGGGGGTAPVIQRDDFAGDGVTVAFSLSGTPTTGGLIFVALNGSAQPKTAFTLTGGLLTMGAAPITGDTLSVSYYTTLPGSVSHIQEDFAGAGSTDFTLAHAPAIGGVLFVSLNGNVQLVTAWSIFSSTTLRFVSAPQSGDSVSISYNY